MKFYCDACNTKYAISDDKVRGKVLRVRCKRCDNVIVVRELQDQSEVSVARRAAPALPKSLSKPDSNVPQNNWHYAINGVTHGPFVIGALRAKYESGSIGDETYVWHDSFDSWKPVASVSFFEDALNQGRALNPRFETKGFTGPVEAVSSAQPSKETEGVVPERPNTKRARTPESKPRSLEALRDKPSASSKLDRLKKRLAEDEPSVPSLAAAAPQPVSSSGPALQAPPIEPKLEPKLGTMSEGTVDLDAESDLSELLEAASAASAPSNAEVEASDLIGQAISELVQESEATPHAPMFPVSPDVGQERSQGQITGSLLIQLQDIQKTGRGKRLILGAVIFLALGVIATAATVAYIYRPVEETPVATNQEPEREFEIKRYSKDEQNKFAKLELGEETLAPMTPELIAEIERETLEEEKIVAAKKTEKPAPKVAAPSGSDSPPKTTEKPQLAKLDSQKKTASSTPKSSAKPTDILAPRSTINRPVDTLLTGETKTKLSREDAQRGFRKISRHVSLCRERHAARSGKPLGASKVKLTVDVEPSGKVSAYGLPKPLRNTAFDACLKSKKDTWRFARFAGPGVKINRTFVLQ